MTQPLSQEATGDFVTELSDGAASEWSREVHVDRRYVGGDA